MENIKKGSLTLGIDIGGTNTVFGIVDADGNILLKGKISTDGYETFHDFISMLHKEVKNAMTEAGLPYSSLGAVGVGAPCLSPETGMIEGAVNLPWPSPLPLVEELEKIFHLPAGGENDANAAALGEIFYGGAKNLNNFIMLTLGTGVGSAIVCDGRLLHGRSGFAGELGHTRICKGEDARACNCGRKGCLDAYASAPGLVRTAENMMLSTEIPSKLRSLSALNAKDVGKAAEAGDKLALEALHYTGRILGEACADFATFSSPEAFIFFGGVANAFPLFKESLISTFNEECLFLFRGKVEFIQSELPESDAALLGAAAVGRTLLKEQESVKLEICTGDPEGVLAAMEGGADRVELCSGLAEGGLTPSMAMISYSSRLIPTNVLIRPRAGDFVYTEDELRVMEDDVRRAVEAGANGIVVGALTRDGEVDIKACERLLGAAPYLDTTFHRAFDQTADPFRALEDIISLGFKRILTSGQANTAMEGGALISKLVEQAAGRIKIMAGAGVTPGNVEDLIRLTGVEEVHASARSLRDSEMTIDGKASMGMADGADGSRMATDPEMVVQIKKSLN